MSATRIVSQKVSQEVHAALRLTSIYAIMKIQIGVRQGEKMVEEVVEIMVVVIFLLAGIAGVSMTSHVIAT